MTVIHVLVDEKLSERAETLGEIFRSEIAALKSPLVQQVRGKGLLNAIVIDEASSARGKTAWQFCLLLKSRGVCEADMLICECSRVLGGAVVDAIRVAFALPRLWLSPRRTSGRLST